MKNYQERIGYGGDIEPILENVCEDYKIGEYASHIILTVGYEDFNLILKTSKGKYFIKMFSKLRTKRDCKRYIEILEEVSESTISTPRLFKSSRGYLFETKFDAHDFRLCVMEYIDGQSFFDAKIKPSKSEMRFLIGQAALINSIDYKPEFFYYDDWAIVNFIKEYEKKKQYLGPDDLRAIDPLAKSFRKLDLNDLPHCLVHGDLISTNIIKSDQGGLYIIDFSVSNYCPRIIELAILFCNMLFNENDPKNSDRNYAIALEEYQKIIPLEKIEVGHLPLFVKVAHAMHVIGGTYEKVVNHHPAEESDYWINSGRKGLIE